MRTAVLVLLLASFASAQSFEEKLAKKLESPFLKKAAWVLDYDAARAKAKAEKKPIFAYFTRSYAP